MRIINERKDRKKKELKFSTSRLPIRRLVVGDVSMSGELRVFFYFLLLGGGRKKFYSVQAHRILKKYYIISKKKIISPAL